MKKIINFFLKQPEYCVSYSSIESAENMTRDEINAIISPYPLTFMRMEDTIKYNPPYGIHDKHSLQGAISKAFPKGMPQKALQLCYEFAESDLHELSFQNGVYFHNYGKKSDKILFAPPLHNCTKISTLWSSITNDYSPMSNIFKRKLDQHVT